MFFDTRSTVTTFSSTFIKVVRFKIRSENMALDLESRNYLNFYTLSVNS